ncbi:MAG: P-loop NTPase [Thermoanaerobacteraceae bacterium]|jgi:MinD superfamily P-loop ATPase|nr:P-loop NTPase [Thermoanaerobacteraceae bacterium]
MNELVIISGKGGTGKTTVTASLAALSNKSVLTDCDVDAADLYLLLNPQIKQTFEFWGGKKARINSEKCIKCGKCIKVCRFNAINIDYKVNEHFCEGCHVCYHICPEKAIDLIDNLSGHWYISDTEFGHMVFAKLGIAQENSGLLVAAVRKAAKEIAKREGYKYIITDGPPGIGCPVIASLSGASIAVIVTEPSVSGKHDLERIIDLCKNFKVQIKVIINKYNISQDKSFEIEKYCKSNNIEVLGKIPFDEDVVKSIAQGIPLVKFSKGPAAKAIKAIAERLIDICP